MCFQKPFLRAYTLIELMIVVILVGLIAGFGIPNYEKTMARAKERDALSNLDTMLDAFKLYMSRNDDAFPPDLADIAAINSTLNLNIIEQQDNTYQCDSPDANTYRCLATNADGWEVVIELDVTSGEDLYCTNPPGGCPTTPVP